MIPTTEGSWADRLHGNLVAFTADHIAPATDTGWSILVHGTAHVHTRPRPMLSVNIERITGRRITLTAASCLVDASDCGRADAERR